MREFVSEKQRDYVQEFQKKSGKAIKRELLEKRNEKTKVFETDDNKRVFNFHISPIHFEENGEWKDIDERLELVAGKLKPKSAGFDLDLPQDFSRLGFRRGALSVNFVPMASFIEVEPIPTGVRKLVTLNSKPISNQVLFDFSFTSGAQMFFTDPSKLHLQDGIRDLLIQADAERLSLEKQGKYADARRLHEKQELLEQDLRECALTEWDQVSEVVFQGPMELRLGNDVVYVRHPMAWDSNNDVTAIEIKLKKDGDKFYFVKIIPQEFLDSAVYPVKTDGTASYYADSGDGYVRYDNATWSTCRGATTGSIVDPTNTSTITASSYWTGSDYRIWRGFYPFDTSAIDDSATISSASFNFTQTGSKFDANTTDVDIVSATQASTSTLTTADYDQVGSTVFGSASFSSISGATSISLDSNGIANISKTGYSKFGARNSRDTDDSAPTGQNTINHYFSEQTGTGSDPYLSVVTSSAFSQTVTDTTSMTASAIKSPTKVVSASITSTASVVRAIAHVLNDTMTATGSAIKGLVRSIIAGVITTTTDFVGSLTFYKTVTDTISTSTVFARTWTVVREISNTITATGSAIKGIVKSVLGGAVIADIVVIGVTFIKSITNSITATSSLARSWTTTRVMSNAITATGSATKGLVRSITAGAITIADSLVKKPIKNTIEFINARSSVFNLKITLNSVIQSLVWKKRDKPNTPTWHKRNKP